jgi:RNA polymerase sigma-70 factor (ECF subfamily)
MSEQAVASVRLFEEHRGLLLAHAYRMLGDRARAEDMVQEAWLRWQGCIDSVESPRAYLVTLLTRLCLNELDSARARKEENRGDRLPEPVDLSAGGLARVDALERVSMAFMVLLQRLTPAERAVLLLRDVFDFEYAEIARLVDKGEPTCRKLLERARRRVAEEKRLFSTSPEEHQRMLLAFTQAASAGDLKALLGLLAEHATITTDGGPEGRVTRGVRNLTAPLAGASAVAAFVLAATQRNNTMRGEIHELNGQPALVLYDQGAAFAAILLSIAEGRIERIYFHADVSRLRYLGPARQPS